MNNRLEENNTPQDYTLSGLKLGSVNLRLLGGYVANNTSLLGLHLSRKELLDVDAKEIALMLNKNKNSRNLNWKVICLALPE